jgi:hypothetical protein
MMKFPIYEGINSTYKLEADNADIRSAIVGAVDKATEQVKDMAIMFSGGSTQEVCKKIFDFLKKEIKYVADGENQIIRYPSALLKTKTGDCKSYSLFTTAILNNLGIPNKFVLQSFNNDPTPSHIFVETLSGVKVDAVWGTFNSEKRPTYRYTIPVMNVKYMSGIGCTACQSTKVTGIGALSTEDKAACDKKYPVLKTWFGDTNKVPRAACYASKNIEDLNLKQYLGAPIRSLILGFYKLNIDGIASKIQKAGSQAKYERDWISRGGDPKDLFNAIKEGASKPARNIGILSKLKSLIIDIVSKRGVKVSGIGATAEQNALIKKMLTDGTTSTVWRGALVTAGGTALGVVGSVIPGLGTALGAGSGAVLGEMLYNQTDNMVDFIFPVDDIPKTTPSPSPVSLPKEAGSPIIPGGSGSGNESGGSGSMIFIVGGAALALYLLSKK